MLSGVNPQIEREGRTVAVDDTLVVLKLAHPLNPEQAQRVGAEPKQYLPGDDLIVGVNAAMTVINAGVAQVDPTDQAAVLEALGNHPGLPAAPAGNGGSQVAKPPAAAP